MQDFKIRASACGKIMTTSKTKDPLSQTAKSYLEEWYIGQMYNREKEIKSKYTQKGLWGENSAINLYGEWSGQGLLIKNEEHKQDQYMSGTCDLVLSSSIDDIKCSWDCFTFPLFDTELPSKDYFWQGQTYMHLWVKELFRVVYMLIDTPDLIIESEAKKYCLSNGIEDIDMDIYESFKSRMTYANIPIKLRMKIFEVKRDQEKINQIIEKHKYCQDYIDQISKQMELINAN
jgi:hypothetical protein